MGVFISDVTYQGEIESDLYLKNISAVKYLEKNRKLTFNKPITVFVGENGTGKSTLLEAIAVAFGFNAEGGTVNFRFETKRSHSELHKHLTVVKRGYPKDGYFLRAESFYNAATYIDKVYESELQMGMDTPYGDVSLHEQSHGESFMSLVENKFRGEGLYILDEPEAALSPMRILRLLVNIKELADEGAQFIIATHSPFIMALPGADVFEFSAKGIKAVDYKETEHFLLTKDFVSRPERMLGYLFDEEDNNE